MNQLLRKLMEEEQPSSDGIPQWIKAAFIIVVLTVLIIGNVFFSRWEARINSAREEVIKSLSAMREEASVTIEGIRIENPKVVIDALLLLDEHHGHHSHPEYRIRVNVCDSDQSITLDLWRDSEIPSEYWVYDPNRTDLNSTEIGSFRTDLLSEWNGKREEN